MVIKNVTIHGSEIAWQTPDKQRTIYKLSVTTDGKKGTLQTWSDKLGKSEADAHYEVLDAYEKESKNGGQPQWFVKLPQQDNGYQQRNFNSQPSYNSAPTAAQPKFDQKANSDGQRQGMCINNAVQYAIKYMEMTGEQFSPDGFKDCVHAYAHALYQIDLNEAPKQDTVLEEIRDEPVDFSKVDL